MPAPEVAISQIDSDRDIRLGLHTGSVEISIGSRSKVSQNERVILSPEDTIAFCARGIQRAGALLKGRAVLVTDHEGYLLMWEMVYERFKVVKRAIEFNEEKGIPVPPEYHTRLKTLESMITALRLQEPNFG